MEFRIDLFDRRSVLHRLAMFQAVAQHGHNPTDDFKLASSTLAVFAGQELAAYASFVCYHGHWFLRNCVVAPKFRGQGLQRRLIAERAAHIKGRGGKSVSVWVDPKNAHSLRNLVACGFAYRPDQRDFKGITHVGLRLVLA